MSGLRSSSFASKGKNIWKKVGETRRDRRTHSILILISGEQWLFGGTFEGLKARAYCTKKDIIFGRRHYARFALPACVRFAYIQSRPEWLKGRWTADEIYCLRRAFSSMLELPRNWMEQMS